MDKLLHFLDKCNEAYSIGSVYIITEEDSLLLFQKLNIMLNANTLVSDQIYDLIYTKVKNLDINNPYFNQLTSINAGYGKDVELKYPAGSLTECKPYEIEKWLEKFNSKDSFICSHKLDGLSLILIYDNGILQQAITRGDGHIGKDVTRHIVTLTNVPKTIPEKSYLVIRGECICPKDEISLMLTLFHKETNKEYKNGRNTIAGFLNNKKTIEAGKNLIHVVCYDIMNEDWSLENKLKVLKVNHFEVVPYKKYTLDKLNTEFLQQEFLDVKLNSKYECDGVVITHNIIGKREFETGTINPTNSRKFKTLADVETAETVIENITWQISKWGKFTPVLNIKPVLLSGATITNVSGFNYKQVKDNGWGINAKVLVQRSGDVIPKINKTIEPSNNIPLPNCETIINGVDLYIDPNNITSKYAFDIRVEQIISCAEALKLDQVGPGNVIEILQQYQITHKDKLLEIEEFLGLSKQYFKQIIGVNGEKIYNSIHKKVKDIKESTFFGAMGTFGQGISKEILKKIENKYGKLDISLSELNEIDGLGPNRIQQINSNYDNYYIKKRSALKNIQDLSFKVITINNEQSNTEEYKVIFTGFRSEELKTLFEQSGGKVVDSFTKDINLVVAKDLDKKSNKILLAEKNGIKVISYQQAIQILKAHQQF